MRLFAGLPIVDDARLEIAGLLDRLRGSAWPVRWVSDDGLHLTLKFFGEVSPDRLDVIEEAVRIAARGTGPLGDRDHRASAGAGAARQASRATGQHDARLCRCPRRRDRRAPGGLAHAATGLRA